MRFKSLAGITCLCAAVVAPSVAGAWTHPGILTTGQNLQNFADFTSTYPSSVSAYSAYKNTYADTAPLFNSGYTIQGPLAQVPVKGNGTTTAEQKWIDDSFAAYYLALRWVREGDSASLTKSRNIVNAWASTFDALTLDSSETYAKTINNQAAWAIPIWINTAEILRDYKRGGVTGAGWSTSDQQQFDTFIYKLWTQVGNNWQISTDPADPNNNTTVTANMAGMAYFAYKSHGTASYGSEYSARRQNVLDLIPLIIDHNYVVKEFTRDCEHPQYSMIAFVQAAVIEKHQNGTTAIFDSIRVKQGLEYIGKRLTEAPTGTDRDCRIDQGKTQLQDGYYQIALRYYGQSAIPYFSAAYAAEIAQPTTNAEPKRSQLFPDAVRLTHGAHATGSL